MTKINLLSVLNASDVTRLIKGGYTHVVYIQYQSEDHKYPIGTILSRHRSYNAALTAQIKGKYKTFKGMTDLSTALRSIQNKQLHNQ